jgi:hypothetical protein
MIIHSYTIHYTVCFTTQERATNRTIQISRADRDKLEDLRYSATLDYDLDLEESVTGKNWRAGKRTKFRGMREVAEGRDQVSRYSVVIR